MRFILQAPRSVIGNAVTTIAAGAFCTSHVAGLSTTGCNSVAKESTREEEEESFYGQCPTRQLWRPNQPYPLWDYDWDGRMTPETTLEALKASGGKQHAGVTRHIILIRHGQYDETHEEDQKRKLTDLGRAQAELTGKRLAVMAQGINDKYGPCKIKVLRVSGMVRARETADILSKHLPSGVYIADPDSLLNEGIPAQIIPVRPEINSENEYDEHHERIEAAFRKYIYRSDPEKAPTNDNEDESTHEFEIVVCHGNVIRYFFCRALQLPPEAWLRMSVFNCSLTYLMIKPNGSVTCRLLGDVGHLGYDHTSFSMSHGFVWS